MSRAEPTGQKKILLARRFCRAQIAPFDTCNCSAATCFSQICHTTCKVLSLVLRNVYAMYHIFMNSKLKF